MGKSQPVKPQIGVCRNAPVGGFGGSGKAVCAAAAGVRRGRHKRPWSSHNALIWINLDMVVSPCRQARAAVGLPARFAGANGLMTGAGALVTR